MGIRVTSAKFTSRAAIILLCALFSIPQVVSAQTGWNVIATPSSLGGSSPNMLYFVSADSGFLQTTDLSYRHTPDGGATWFYDSMPPLHIVYPDDLGPGNIAYTHTGFDSIGRSNDHGATWQWSLLDSAVVSVNSLEFMTPAVGVALGNGPVWRTEDSGNSWNLVHTFIPSTDGDLLFAKFRDSLNGICATRLFNITTLTHTERYWFTSDGGTTWDTLGSVIIDSVAMRLTKLDYLPNAKLWRGIGGFVYFSSDDGKTWQASPVVSNMAVAMSFADEDTGFAVMQDGAIYKSTDGGHGWFEEVVPQNFTETVDPFSPPPADIFAVNGSTVYAVFDTNLIKTTDGGGMPSASVRSTNNVTTISVSPDPATDHIRITSNMTAPSNAVIYDALGRIVYDEQMISETTTIDVRSLCSGVYTVRIGPNTFRFVKQ